jgi:hypothetical protein
MTKIFKHAPLEDGFPDISPAKLSIPDWYKKGHNATKDVKKLPIVLEFKSCSPFQDSFLTGYMLPLPADIAVEQTPDGPIISWNNETIKIVEQRPPNINKELPIPGGHSSVSFVWITKNFFKIPKGYSVLMTHPLNRYDLPFTTMSAVIDGEYTVPFGNVPVFFSNTFEGIIKAGTPIAQIIPFKQEKWKAKLDKNLISKGISNWQKSTNAAFGWYKTNIWIRKEFN